MNDMLTTNQLKQWKTEYERLKEEILEKESRCSALAQLIKAGEAFLPQQSFNLDDPITPPKTQPKQTKVNSESLNKRITHDKKAPVSKKRVTWTETIEKILQDADKPLKNAEIKEKIKTTPLASKLETADKSFYGAILKLENQDRAVKYKGYLFSPSAYLRFDRNLKNGLIEDLPDNSYSKESPLGEEVKNILSENGGITAAEIKDYLLKNIQFEKSIRRNHTYIYNVLKRLLEKDEIVKEEETKTYYIKK